MHILDSKMKGLLPYTINVRGKLLDLSEPKVMGILNVTPDSFFDGSRKQSEKDIRERVRQIVEEGGDIIDIGAYSTRPGASDVTEEEEKRRLSFCLSTLRDEAPDAIVSVDTFRSDVARMCVQEYGAAIINDVSGGLMDPDMFNTVAALNVPYVLTHNNGDIHKIQDNTQYDDVMKSVMLFFAEKVQALRDLGQKDIIIDPGFGFSKTLEQNYRIMSRLENLKVLGLPILSGVSRKSMIYKCLGNTPREALNGTTVLNTVSLMKGANLIRVHDVRECVEAVKITRMLRESL